MNNLLFNKEVLHNFIFNKNSWLFTGNDNNRPPNKFYDTEEKEYRYQLSFPDFHNLSTWDFVEYPTEEELKEVISSMDIRLTKRDKSYIAEERSYSWSSREEYYEPTYSSEITTETIEFKHEYRNKESKSVFVNYKIENI